MPNRIEIFGDEAMIWIGDRCVRINASDVDLVAAYSWHISRRDRYCYPTTGIRKEGGQWTTLYLHRLITNAPKGREVDHINHDPLDNRRDNLRIGSHRDNMRNGRFALTTHCPKGHVYDDANTYINKKGKRICLACAAARSKAALLAETPGQRERRLTRGKAYYQRTRDLHLKRGKEYALAHLKEKREYDRLRRERLKALKQPD